MSERKDRRIQLVVDEQHADLIEKIRATLQPIPSKSEVIRMALSEFAKARGIGGTKTNK